MKINFGNHIEVTLSPKALTALRALAGGRGMRLEVVEGDQPPTRAGRSYGWVSRTGIPWRGRSGPKWGKTYHYTPSTRCVEVGIDWLKAAVWTGAI